MDSGSFGDHGIQTSLSDFPKVIIIGGFVDSMEQTPGIQVWGEEHIDLSGLTPDERSALLALFKAMKAK